MRLGVVIPFFNKWELTHKRMMQAYQFLPEWCEIYLVDDASTDPEIPGGVSFWQKRVSKQKIYYIKNEENKGFGFSMNKGARAAIKQGCDAVVLLSNDVEFLNDFASIVKEQLENNPNILIGGEVLWGDTGWNKLPCMIVPYANGWFLACTAEVWKDIGGFDSRYGLFDFDDLDLSLTAMSRGYKLEAIRPEAKLKHLGGQTIYAYYSDRMERTKKNQMLFIEKWSSSCNELKRLIYGDR